MEDVPFGYGESLKKTFINVPSVYNKLNTGDYCGFNIHKWDNSFSIFIGSDTKKINGFKIEPMPFWGNEFTSLSYKQMALGYTDTFKDAKYFIDQILYTDIAFKITMQQELEHQEKLDKKNIVSLYLKNI